MTTTAMMPAEELYIAIGPYQKRLYTSVEMLTDALALVRRSQRLYDVWVKQRLEPALREEIMVAVSHVNACRYCSFIHEEWARQVGVDDETLEHVEAMHPGDFDRRTWLALVYARALVRSGFQEIERVVDRQIREVFSDEEIADIDAVARAMNFANRSSNTIDAFLMRLHGEPVEGSRALDEALVAGLAALGLATMVPVLCVWRRQTPLGLYRDFQRFSARFFEKLRHGEV